MKADYIKFKLIDTTTGERLDTLVYSLTESEASTLNYAYGTNGVSKRMVPLE
jgi:hypothetical protein